VARGRHYRRRSQAFRSAWPPAVIVLAVIVGVVVWAVSDRHQTAAGPSSTSSVATRSVSEDPSTVPRTTVGPTTSVAVSTTTATTVAPPPTTVAVPPPVVGTDSITYSLPSGTPVLVTAVDSCWIQVRPAASGPVSQEEILQPGQQVSLPSPVWIRFGDPSSARASVGPTPLRLPRLAGQLIVVAPSP
jgi:cytoskeletal protein RodZ